MLSGNQPKFYNNRKRNSFQSSFPVEKICLISFVENRQVLKQLSQSLSIRWIDIWTASCTRSSFQVTELHQTSTIEDEVIKNRSHNHILQWMKSISTQAQTCPGMQPYIWPINKLSMTPGYEDQWMSCLGACCESSHGETIETLKQA